MRRPGPEAEREDNSLGAVAVEIGWVALGIGRISIQCLALHPLLRPDGTDRLRSDALCATDLAILADSVVSVAIESKLDGWWRDRSIGLESARTFSRSISKTRSRVRSSIWSGHLAGHAEPDGKDQTILSLQFWPRCVFSKPRNRNPGSSRPIT